MAQLSLTLGIRKRWFFWPAFWVAVLLLALRLIRDVPCDAYVSGVMPAIDRVADWLFRNALRCDVA